MELFWILVNNKLVMGRSEYRRLLFRNGIKVNGIAVNIEDAKVNIGDVIKVGKKKTHIVNEDDIK